MGRHEERGLDEKGEREGRRKVGQSVGEETYAAPIRPAPMIPTVFRWRRLPTKRVGSQPSYKFALINLSPSTTLLAAERVRAAASSAVVSVKTPAEQYDEAWLICPLHGRIQ